MTSAQKDLVGGGVVFFTLSDDTDRGILAKEWDAVGLNAFLPEPRAHTAVLKDALANVVGDARTLIRPLAKRSGFAVVRETLQATANEYKTIAVAEVSKDGSVTVSPGDEWTGEMTGRVIQAYHDETGKVTANRLASSLVHIIHANGGTRLRPTGGIYWLHGSKLPVWNAAASGAQSAGKNLCYRIEHELTPETVRAVRDALTHEALSQAARIDAEISSGELGDRAIEGRVQEAAILQRKIEEYETILGVGLADLKKAVDAASCARFTGNMIVGTNALQSAGVTSLTGI